MIQPVNTLFSLATYRSAQGEKVGLVIGNRLAEVNQAVSYYRKRKALKGRRESTLSSMLDLLRNWSTSFELLSETALFLREDRGGKLEFQGLDEVPLIAPVPSPGKMINVGLNFYDHAREMGMEIPREGFRPNFFLKGDRNCIIGPSQKIRLSSPWVDWEAEPALIIGTRARNIAASQAMDYIAGFTCHNDLTDRRMMLKKDGGLDFFSGKTRDTFAPLGPFLVPKEFVPDPRKLRIRCLLNEEVMQDTGTENMVWGPEQCIEYVSSCVTLEPGDVLALGTGAGVGWSKGIQVAIGEFNKIIAYHMQGGGKFLRSGDHVAVEIDGLGRLENEVE